MQKIRKNKECSDQRRYVMDMLRAKKIKFFLKIVIPFLINIHTSILQVLINYLCVPPPLRGEGVEGGSRGRELEH